MVKIAIVDDNLLLRKNLELRLQSYPDLEVQSFSSGLQFLEEIQKVTPDNLPEVVLMDIQMRSLDGIETTYQAKVKFPGIEFIMLTVSDDDDTIFRAIQAGASGYLLKEEPASVIVQAILGTKTGEAYMSPVIAKKALNLLRAQSPNPIPTGTTLPEPLPDNLSKREIEILELLTTGNSSQTISEKLFISTYTVQTHIKNIYQKLHVNTKWAAAKLATDHKWFSK
ncbi:response regulator transcription factor [Adhaeribacter pallidiroseus]|uniref:Transcriptional regulatory protein MctR n=1 Tax=Adhaeribacter pallidiroseus TaxID=2072847 RepID=A0A369QPB8_9BACT|nr:response regulator transcription factor [Adhaeribacter pallidiroseus]RDC64058.1 Transcriptional regulatory protein MctR [Adhaeribacter pallidiroseus]